MPLGLLVKRPDQCDAAEAQGTILVCCQNTAVIEETIEDTACMDRGKRHFSTLRYCAEHRHHASEGAA
jgi:hypothetical protein